MADTTKSRIYLAIIAGLVIVIAALAYKFIVAGSTEKGEDGRTAIVLAPSERDLVLREMRSFVAGLQEMSNALSRDDMDGVARAARALGMAKTHEAPAAMMGKLPLAFKKLALGTHSEFDTIALDAESMRMPKHTLSQLSDVLQKCVACHAAYQVKTAPAK